LLPTLEILHLILEMAKDRKLTMHLENAQLDFSVPSIILGVLNSKQLATICKSVGVAKHHFPGVNNNTSICLRGRLDRISVLHAVTQQITQIYGTSEKIIINDFFKTVLVGQVASNYLQTPLLHVHKNIQLESKTKIVYGNGSPDHLYRQVTVSGFMWDIEKAVALIQKAINMEMRTETNTLVNDLQVCFY
jgi:hypothetical protein